VIDLPRPRARTRQLAAEARQRADQIGYAREIEKTMHRRRYCLSITHGYHMQCAKAGEHANADDPVEL